MVNAMTEAQLSSMSEVASIYASECVDVGFDAMNSSNKVGSVRFSGYIRGTNNYVETAINKDALGDSVVMYVYIHVESESEPPCALSHFRDRMSLFDFRRAVAEATGEISRGTYHLKESEILTTAEG